MKTIFFRSKTALLGVALCAYIVWLFMQGSSVAANEQTSLAVLILCGLVGLYLIAIAVFNTLVPTNRWTLCLLGVFMIVFSEMYIIDNPSAHVYLGDILKILGAFLAIAGPARLLVSQKAMQAKEEAEIEIIEV